MDSRSECLVHESVEDDRKQIKNDSVSEKLNSTSESKIRNNGSCAVESNDTNELNQKGAVESGHVALKPEIQPEASSQLHATTSRKGHGLKKWRRIKRDTSKEGGSSIDTSVVVPPDFRYSGANRSKRVQYSEIMQPGVFSIPGTNAVYRKNTDGFAVIDGPYLVTRPYSESFTLSKNSDDRSSKSSTAASAPNTKYETPVTGGFPSDKSKTSSSNGNKLMHPVQFSQRGNKAKGERVKIEKENSPSSMESDSRSSNFGFMRGTHTVSNGVRNEGTNEYDGENGNEVQGIGKEVNDGHEGGYGEGGGGGFEDSSPEDVVADSSSVNKDERGDNHSPLRDNDPLAGSIRALQSAQEALEQEVFKFKEIGNDFPVDGPISELCTEHTDVEQKLEEIINEGSQKSSQILLSEVVETELEELFKQKIEAEVEYLAISKRVQNLKVSAVDKKIVLEEYKALASEQSQILHKLGDAESKAALLKKKAEKLEESRDENANAEDLLKLQRRVGKYGSCFAVQLVVLLVLFFSGFILKYSQDYAELVPT